MKKMLIIEHDNGISGQRGFSEHELFSGSVDEINGIVNEYINNGIFVYNISGTML